MEKRRIREVIVVEGKHDTEKLKKYFDCDTIETNGTHLGESVIEQIAAAQKSRGVIILTDPDSPGNRIRCAVNQAVPGCKNAFVQKKDAHTTKKVGVEHAARNILVEAMENCACFMEIQQETITASDMHELGLSGDHSQKAREYIGEYFHLGMGNAKTMRRRLNGMGLTVESVREALNKWKQE